MYPMPSRSVIDIRAACGFVTPSSGFSSADGISCHECLSGLISSDNASVCVPCPAGWIADASRTSCVSNISLYFAPSLLSHTFLRSCQPCPINYFQTSAITCSACSLGFHTLTSAAVVCQPCPSGTFGHALGGCRACSPGTYRDHESSNNCSVCKAGLYSGHGFPACIPCKQGEFSNGAGSAGCEICAPGSYSIEQSSHCTPCGMNSATNLSMQRACPSCLSGHVAPFSGMTRCFPCPVQQNMSSWMDSIPHNLKANASEAELLLAISIIETSCFHVSGKTRSTLAIDTISASDNAVIAIMCTIAGIILILGSYFARRSCRHTCCAEGSTKAKVSAQGSTTAKVSDVSIPISQMPEHIRSNRMVQLGGEYFHQLIQGRGNASKIMPSKSDIELCRVDDSAVPKTIDFLSPKSTEAIKIPLAAIEQEIEGVQETEKPPEQLTVFAPSNNQNSEELANIRSESPAVPSLLLQDFEIEEQNVHEVAGVGGKLAGWSELDQDAKHSELMLLERGDVAASNQKHFSGSSSSKLEQNQDPLADQQQYQGKKYQIDLDNVR